jgi:hypothetical protein
MPYPAVTTSNWVGANGSAIMSAATNIGLVGSCRFAFASSSIRGVMSSPTVCAPRAVSSNVMSPVPHARSSTRMPAEIDASAASLRFQRRSCPYESSTVIKS